MEISLVSVSIKYWWSSNSAHFIVSKNYTVRDGERGGTERGGQGEGIKARKTEQRQRGRGKQDESCGCAGKNTEGVRERETEGERWHAYNMFYELKSCSSISFIPLAIPPSHNPLCPRACLHTHIQMLAHTAFGLTGLIGCNVDWQLLGGIRALVGDSVDCLWNKKFNGQLFHRTDINHHSYCC